MAVVQNVVDVVSGGRRFQSINDVQYASFIVRVLFHGPDHKRALVRPYLPSLGRDDMKRRRKNSGEDP